MHKIVASLPPNSRGIPMKRTSQRLKASKAMTKGIKELGMAEDAAREQMPLRVISSGSDDYVSGPRFTDALPQGTNWVRYSLTDRPTSQPPAGNLGTHHTQGPAGPPNLLAGPGHQGHDQGRQTGQGLRRFRLA